MEAAPLTWLESLKKNSINSWDDLKTVLTSNYAGPMQHPGNKIVLSHKKVRPCEATYVASSTRKP